MHAVAPRARRGILVEPPAERAAAAAAVVAGKEEALVPHLARDRAERSEALIVARQCWVDIGSAQEEALAVRRRRPSSAVLYLGR